MLLKIAHSPATNEPVVEAVGKFGKSSKVKGVPFRYQSLRLSVKFDGLIEIGGNSIREKDSPNSTSWIVWGQKIDAKPEKGDFVFWFERATLLQATFALRENPKEARPLRGTVGADSLAELSVR